MDVSAAVNKRSSIRQFRPDSISDDMLRGLLADASRAPSGGNLQPWRIYVVNGSSMNKLREFLPTQPPLDEPEYTNRFGIGEQMYATLGIEREDKAGRQRQFAHNNDFFGAPAAIFCYVDRQMGLPQWSDLGMFLQTFMLLAVEQGLATCAQEYWSVRHKAISTFLGTPENEMMFCGMSVGYADESALINTLRSERMPLEQWVRFV
jgi:nitroreductase